MPKKVKPEDLKLRLSITASTAQLSRLDDFLARLRSLCVECGAEEKEAERLTTRSGFLQECISLLGEKEIQEAVVNAVLAWKHLDKVPRQTSLAL